MNSCMLIGRVDAAPEQKTIGDGFPMLSFTLAVKMHKPKANRTEDMFEVSIFGDKVGPLADTLRVGDMVAAGGRINIRHYKGNDDSWKMAVGIIASNIEVVGSTPGSAANTAAVAQGPTSAPAPASPSPADDDLPF